MIPSYVRCLPKGSKEAEEIVEDPLNHNVPVSLKKVPRLAKDALMMEL